MAYLDAADFRSDTLASWCRSFLLSDAEIDDTDLNEIIAEMSGDFDRYTRDHFERDVGSSISVTVNSGTDTLTATAHGLSNGWIIRVSAASMPGGLSPATDYFVVGAAANTFQLSLTSGGAAIDITSNGTTVVRVSQTTSITVDAIGGRWLDVPRRIRVLFSVETQDSPPTWTVEPAVGYRFVPFTGLARQINYPRIIEVAYGHTLATRTGGWPCDEQS